MDLREELGIGWRHGYSSICNANEALQSIHGGLLQNLRMPRAVLSSTEYDEAEFHGRVCGSNLVELDGSGADAARQERRGHGERIQSGDRGNRNQAGQRRAGGDEGHRRHDRAESRAGRHGFEEGGSHQGDGRGAGRSRAGHSGTRHQQSAAHRGDVGHRHREEERGGQGRIGRSAACPAWWPRRAATR